MNKQQFIRNVELCQKEVRRFLTALCNGEISLAEDLAQDSFVKAYLNIDKINDESKFKAWIYRIAYNTFLSHTRTVRNKSTLSDAYDMISDDTPEHKFRYQSLYNALSMLPEKIRSAILLYYMSGYTIKEIAEITDCTEETVRQQLSRGRKHLKGLLVE